MKILRRLQIRLLSFNKAADLIAEEFIEVYFDGEAYVYWVNGDRSGVMAIDYYFVPLSDMVFALENKVKADIFFKYYEQSLEAEKPYTTLSHYVNNIKTEALKELKQK